MSYLTKRVSKFPKKFFMVSYLSGGYELKAKWAEFSTLS
jgi:hypothetical protein